MGTHPARFGGRFTGPSRRRDSIYLVGDFAATRDARCQTCGARSFRLRACVGCGAFACPTCWDGFACSACTAPEARLELAEAVAMQPDTSWAETPRAKAALVQRRAYERDRKARQRATRRARIAQKPKPVPAGPRPPGQPRKLHPTGFERALWKAYTRAVLRHDLDSAREVLAKINSLHA